MKNNKKGFTLAELLIVVAIIAVLVAISIPIFSTQLEKSKEATDAANIRSAYAQLVADYLDKGVSDSISVKAAGQNAASWITNPTWPSNLNSGAVTGKTSGSYKVKIDKNGKVTVN